METLVFWDGPKISVTQNYRQALFKNHQVLSFVSFQLRSDLWLNNYTLRVPDYVLFICSHTGHYKSPNDESKGAQA